MWTLFFTSRIFFFAMQLPLCIDVFFIKKNPKL